MASYRIKDRQIVKARKPFAVDGITVEAFAVIHCYAKSTAPSRARTPTFHAMLGKSIRKTITNAALCLMIVSSIEWSTFT
jgi:hypothetical protein